MGLDHSAIRKAYPNACIIKDTIGQSIKLFGKNLMI